MRLRRRFHHRASRNRQNSLNPILGRELLSNPLRLKISAPVIDSIDLGVFYLFHSVCSRLLSKAMAALCMSSSRCSASERDLWPDSRSLMACPCEFPVAVAWNEDLLRNAFAFERNVVRLDARRLFVLSFQDVRDSAFHRQEHMV